eukprot:365866-Chlamydomonas_euryale.AAC.12
MQWRPTPHRPHNGAGCSPCLLDIRDKGEGKGTVVIGRKETMPTLSAPPPVNTLAAARACWTSVTRARARAPSLSAAWRLAKRQAGGWWLSTSLSRFCWGQVHTTQEAKCGMWKRCTQHWLEKGGLGDVWGKVWRQSVGCGRGGEPFAQQCWSTLGWGDVRGKVWRQSVGCGRGAHNTGWSRAGRGDAWGKVALLQYGGKVWDVEEAGRADISILPDALEQAGRQNSAGVTSTPAIHTCVCFRALYRRLRHTVAARATAAHGGVHTLNSHLEFTPVRACGRAHAGGFGTPWPPAPRLPAAASPDRPPQRPPDASATERLSADLATLYRCARRVAPHLQGGGAELSAAALARMGSRRSHVPF